MSDTSNTTIPSAEVKTALTRSEQRKKNRQDHKGQKKHDGSGEASVGLFTRIITFFTEAKDELRKVVWPTRKETVDSTWRLLILVILAGIYLGLVDSILNKLVGLIL